MVTNAATICRGALRLISAIRQGEAGDPDDITEAYQAAQEMLDQWATDRLLCVVVEQADFPLVSGQQDYTIGEGGNFNRQRPLWLDRASILQFSNPQLPLELGLDVLDYGQWQEIPVKATTSSLPRRLYFDGNVGTLAKLKYWPIPSITTLQTRLYCPTALTQFASQTADYTFPQGYVGALRYNLAIALAPEYDTEPSQAVVAKAAEYLSNIRAMNDKAMMIGVDQALLRSGDTFNFYTGESR